MTLPLVLALFKNDYDRIPRRLDVCWPELAEHLLVHKEQRTKNGQLWSPTEYRPGSLRKKANVERLYVLTLDVDHHNPPHDLLSEREHVSHTTYSHRPDDPRWRVILPLTEPVGASDWPMFWQRARSFFGGCVDEATKDASRMYWFPACKPDAERSSEWHRGRLLDPGELPALPEPPKRETPRNCCIRAKPRFDFDREKDSDSRSRLETWAQQYMTNRVAELASMAANSGRHCATVRTAYCLGGLVAAGLLNGDDVTIEIRGGCARNGLIDDDGERSVEAAIRSGIEAGRESPWSPEDQPDRFDFDPFRKPRGQQLPSPARPSGIVLGDPVRPVGITLPPPERPRAA